ncbi:MAG: hypothetical protein ACRD06_00060 [Terriglobia bacterium]
MCSTMLAVLREVRFHELLLRIDRNLAEQVRQGRCRLCGAALHAGHFDRKPRGGLPQLSDEHRERFSWCCARDGCRSRAMPPSMRFLGHKVYLGAVVVLVSALRCGATPVRMVRLAGLLGVSRRTVNRWRQWWTEVFVQTRCWVSGSGLFAVPVPTAQLPLSLLERFVGPPETALLALLRFVLPVTDGEVAVRVM